MCSTLRRLRGGRGLLQKQLDAECPQGIARLPYPLQEAHVRRLREVCLACPYHSLPQWMPAGQIRQLGAQEAIGRLVLPNQSQRARPHRQILLVGRLNDLSRSQSSIRAHYLQVLRHQQLSSEAS